jgi:hypothetical protein
MPDLPIDQLPSASALQPNNVFPVVQDNVTKQATYSSILYAPGNNYGLFTQTVSSTPITNTTTETSLISTGVGTLSVPANGFSIGDSFYAISTGHISAQNNNTLRFRVKANGVLLVDTGVLTLAGTTNKHYKLELFFTVRTLGGSGVASIVTGGNFTYIKDASTNFEGQLFSTETSTGFNTTIQNTLTVTAQWGAANVNNSIYSDIFTLNKTY